MKHTVAAPTTVKKWFVFSLRLFFIYLCWVNCILEGEFLQQIQSEEILTWAVSLWDFVLFRIFTNLWLRFDRKTHVHVIVYAWALYRLNFWSTFQILRQFHTMISDTMASNITCSKMTMHVLRETIIVAAMLTTLVLLTATPAVHSQYGQPINCTIGCEVSHRLPNSSVTTISGRFQCPSECTCILGSYFWSQNHKCS